MPHSGRLRMANEPSLRGFLVLNRQDVNKGLLRGSHMKRAAIEGSQQRRQNSEIERGKNTTRNSKKDKGRRRKRY